MPLFLSSYPEPFSVQLEYVKDSFGNTIAVTIPIDIWNVILKKYKTIFVNEEATAEDNTRDHETID